MSEEKLTEKNEYVSSILLPNGFKILTDDGCWDDLVSINETVETQTIRLKTESGKTLVCSENHILFTENGETFAKDVYHKRIKTVNGYELVTELEKSSKQNLYDVTCSEHIYLTNNIKSHNCVCIDEACFVDHLDDILQAIGPTLTRDKDSELIFTTTPAGKNGYFYDLYQNALQDEDWFVQHTTIHDAISDGLDVNIESLHTICPDPDVFKQEYECVFSNEFGSMIDVECFDYYDEDINDFDGVYFSADIGRTHDKTAITILKTKKDIIYVDDVITLSKCEYQKQLDIFKQLNDKYKFRGGYIDSGGIGSAVAEFTNKQISVKIKPFTFTGSNKTPAYELLRDKIFQRKLKFKRIFKKKLEDDFRNVSRIVTEDGTVKYQAGSNDNGHSDHVSSIVLGVQAIHDFPINATTPITSTRYSAFGNIVRRI